MPSTLVTWCEEHVTSVLKGVHLPSLVIVVVIIIIVIVVIPGVPRRMHSLDSFAVGLCVQNACFICRGKLVPPHA
jgi:membrane protein YdbS with pleckstrin-like domain